MREETTMIRRALDEALEDKAEAMGSNQELEEVRRRLEKARMRHRP